MTYVSPDNKRLAVWVTKDMMEWLHNRRVLDNTSINALVVEALVRFCSNDGATHDELRGTENSRIHATYVQEMPSKDVDALHMLMLSHLDYFRASRRKKE